MEFLIYCIKCAVIMNILYLVYWLFMRKETYFAHNRFFLLASLILSLIIPILNFDLQNAPSVIQDIPVTEIVINAIGGTTNVSSGLTTVNVLFFIYLTGVILFSLRFLFRLMIFYATLHVNNYSYINGHKVYITNNNQPAFSFLRTIVLPKDIINTDKLDKILKHEAVHTEQLHSIDIIIIELITIFTWFNPVIYLYKKSITLIHEYLADSNVLKEGCNKNEYQKLLLAQCFNTEVSAISNNFNKKITKNRFIMMSKIKSTAISKYKLLFALPIILITLSMFSLNNNQNKSVKTEILDISDYAEELAKSLGETVKFPNYVLNEVSIEVHINCSIVNSKTIFKIDKVKGRDKVQRVRNLNTDMMVERVITEELSFTKGHKNEAEKFFIDKALKSLNNSSTIKQIAKSHKNGKYKLIIIYKNSDPYAPKKSINKQ